MTHVVSGEVRKIELNAYLNHLLHGVKVKDILPFFNSV
jgi:hypothetical protein